MRTILIILSIFFFTNANGQITIKTKKLLQDFDYAVSELRLQHQGFYQYVDKETVDADILSLRNQLKTPMTKLEFYALIRKLNALMNEGHGSVNIPNWTKIKIGITKSFFPLGVSYYDKELIIAQNFGEDIPGLTKGMKLLSIDGEPIESITEKLMPLISTDGFNETSKYKWVGGVNFILLYRLIYGKKKAFELEIIGPNNSERQKLTVPAIRYKALKAKNAKFKNKNFSHSKFGFEQINDSIGYLSIPTFRKSSNNYPKFYQEQFKKIDSLKIKHLIIDIQSNGGGEEGNENLLFSYLMKDRIRKYKKVTMLPAVYDINKKSKGIIFDKWALKGSIAERGEFTCYSDYYSNLGYKPPSPELVYEHKLYVLISGYTFSGGAEFASMIKMTNRATFIGIETGGAYEGNVSSFSETIKLPNTKIKISIPSVHFQMEVNPIIKGRGIMPDYEVPQTWDDYMNNKNAKLDFTKEMIVKMGQHLKAN